ncbi:MAG: DUF1616 domain-containing protein [Dehalococcoidia bacterium]|nr:DUF1616 domain-containing protein [Dehalococcoidia bacterium]
MFTRNIDLIIAAACALATVAVVLLVPALGPIRIVLGLPFLLLLPGYALLAALYPRKGDLDPIERVALSFGLSIAIVPLIGLGLNYSPWGIRLNPILAFVTLFIVMGAGAAAYRRRAVPAEEAFAINVSLPRWSQVGLARVAAVLIVVLCSIGFGAAAFLATSRGSSESFTEFYILGPDGRAEGYPRTLELGDSLTVTLGVVNHEGEDAGYRIEATVAEKAAGLTDRLRLEDGERWEEPMTLAPNQAGNSQEVEFLLYKDGVDGVDEAYRAVHLWVDVKGPQAEATPQPKPTATVSPTSAASPTPLPTPPPPVLTAGAGGLVYVVEPDDTLTSVGERFGVSPEAIAAANGMPEPGPILAGEELMIPGTTYVVQAGDSLASIAAAFGVTPAAIMEANGIADASTIYAGREVAIPGVAP